MRNLIGRCGAGVLALSAALLSLPAEAAPPVGPKVQRACKDDYKRLCPHYRPNSPQMRACMEAKALEISYNCVTALIDEGVVDRKRAGR